MVALAGGTRAFVVDHARVSCEIRCARSKRVVPRIASSGSEQGIAETLVQTSALLFAGLGVAIAFRAGLFNIGAEGQLTVGGLCTALVGASLHLTAALLEIPLCLLAGAAGGAVWGGIAGVLRARFGASEVITTIMLNYIAFLGAGYLVSGPLRGDANAPETAPIAATAMLPPLLADTRLTAALPIALALAIALAWWPAAAPVARLRTPRGRQRGTRRALRRRGCRTRHHACDGDGRCPRGIGRRD